MSVAHASSAALEPMGALAGLLFAVGGLLIAWRLRALRPRLVARVEPYLREPPGSSGLLNIYTPFPQLERVLQPVLADVGKLLDRLGSPTHSVRQRLLRSGSQRRVEEFRIEQVVWATVALGGGLFLALILAAVRQSHPLALLVLVLVLSMCGALGRDYLLTRRVKQREQAMAAQFPTIAELLALAVSAGETPLGAVERVTQTAQGALSEELTATVADVRSGIPLPRALAALANRTEVPAIARFTDGVATAIERGTPLAEVLRAQAQDARSAGHQALMEIGGKKEIAMMVPVVFLLLPVTVLFALFPGIHMLSMS